MAKVGFKFWLETTRRNYGLTQWPGTVLDVFDEPNGIVEAFHKQAASIAASPNLTREGKAAERTKAAKATLDALKAWHTPRLAGLDADLGKHRAALLVPPAEKPDGRRIDFLLSRLLSSTAQRRTTSGA
jgi:hypothetical protein